MITSNWQPLAADVREFLAEFERRGAAPESDSGDQFAETFIVADPSQASTVGRDVLVASMPYRRDIFAKAGVGSARCVDAAQLELDEHHVLVTSDWDADRGDNPPVRLESTFVLRRESPGLSIIAYINHRDIAAVLASL